MASNPHSYWIPGTNFSTINPDYQRWDDNFTSTQAAIRAEERHVAKRAAQAAFLLSEAQRWADCQARNADIDQYNRQYDLDRGLPPGTSVHLNTRKLVREHLAQRRAQGIDSPKTRRTFKQWWNSPW